MSINTVKHLSVLRKDRQSRRSEQRQSFWEQKPKHTDTGKKMQGSKEMKMSEIVKLGCLRLQITCNGSRNDLSSAVVLPFTYH